MDPVPPDPVPPDPAALAGELLPRLRRWDSASWAVPAVLPVGPPGTGSGRVPTRAEVAAAAVQRLADAGADAEGRPRRTVPLLSEVNLGDQLTVMVEDILRTADPPALRAAAAELAALKSALGYR